MKKTSFTILLLIISFGFITAQKVRSISGNIPFQNIHGWENKSAVEYFKSSICEQSYYKIKLTGFDIGVKRDKKWWKKYSPFLLIKVQSSNKEFISFIPTDKLEKVDLDKDFSIRSIYNETLLGAFPYDGSDIKITVNLYAFKTKDNLQKVLNALGNFKDLFSNQLNQFIAISERIKNGLDEIIPDCENVISYQSTWNPNQNDSVENPNTFKEGYVIIHPESKSLNYNHLRITNQSQIKIVKDNQEQFLYSQNVDHVVLQFQHFMSRQDRDLFTFYDKFIESLNYATNKRLEECRTSYNESMDLLYANDNFTIYDKYLTDLELSTKIENQCRQIDDKFRLERNLYDPCTNKAIDEDNKALALVEAVYRSKMIEKGIIQTNSNLSLTELIEFEKSLSDEELKQLKDELKNLSIDETASTKINQIISTECEKKFTATDYLNNDAAKLKLIHFTADWCAPCKWFRKNTIEPLKKVYSPNELSVFEIDIESDLGKIIATDYEITTLPQIMLLNENNCIIQRIQSIKTFEEMDSILKSFN